VRTIVIAMILPATLLLSTVEARRPWPRPAATGSAGRAAAKLPPKARRIVSELARKRARIYKRAAARMAPLRRAAIRKLKALQDRYCRAAKLDEALAVREQIRRVLGVRPDPGYLRARPRDVGKTFLFEVVGSTSGSIWGSQIYTTDSHLGTAAVHTGVLKIGQRAVVKVHIWPGQQQYAGSAANGVTSNGFGPWGLSFTVEAHVP